MANPLPYYRILRDRLSGVLHAAVGHLRAVPLRGHLAGAGSQRRDIRRDRRHVAPGVGAGSAQRRAARRPAVASAAVPRGVRHGFVRRDPSRALPAVASEVGRRAGSQDPRAGQRAARSAAAAGFLRPDPGVRRHRRGFDGVRITGPTRRSRAASVGRGQCRQPGRARRGRRHRRKPGPTTSNT